MAVTINQLCRGGFSAYGQSSYDARAGVIVISAQDTEIVNVSATFQDAVSSVNYDQDGIETSEPVISAQSITFELSNFNAGARIKYDVVLASGEMVQLNIEIAGAARRSIYSGSGDYGSYP